MPKFKFVGDYTGDTETIDSFGYKFAGDKATDVPEADEKALAKLRGNPDFEEQGSRGEAGDKVGAAKAKSAEAADKVEAARLAEETKRAEECAPEEEEAPVASTDLREQYQVSKGEREAAFKADADLAKGL